jgi:hypothetical protein
MNAGSFESGSIDLLRFPVSLLEYPGMRSEIVIGDTMVLLLVLNPRSEIQAPLVEIRLPLSDFVERQGRKLQFCSRYSGFSGSSVDFAGKSSNAWFHITCNDEASAVIITERIGHLLKARRNPLLDYFRTLLPE